MAKKKKRRVTVKAAHRAGIVALKATQKVRELYDQTDDPEVRATLAYYGVWVLTPAQWLAKKVPAFKK